MMYKIFSFLSLLLIFSGCSNSVEKVNKTVKLDQFPKHQVPKVVQPPKANAKGSLFSSRSNSFFTDRKILQVGDIVVVQIDEGTGGGKTLDGKERETSTSSDLNNKQLFNERTSSPVTITPNEDTPGIFTSILSTINGIFGIDFSIGNTKSTFTTTSSSSLDDQLKNDLSAVITQEFQNGNYFLQGEKTIVIRGQKIILELSGVMNPQDLPTNNIIKSSRLANLKVMIYKEGTEAELDEKPWGTKLIDTITPF